QASQRSAAIVVDRGGTVTDRDTDPIVQRAVDELRRLPALDHAAVRRIATAAAQARLTPADDDVVVRARPRVRWWLTAGLAAAAGVIGFVTRGVVSSNSARTVEVARVGTPVVAEAPMRQAASRGSEVPLVPQQFVLELATARSVSVVGDFNHWDPKATPMVRGA